MSHVKEEKSLMNEFNFSDQDHMAMGLVLWFIWYAICVFPVAKSCWFSPEKTAFKTNLFWTQLSQLRVVSVPISTHFPNKLLFNSKEILDFRLKWFEIPAIRAQSPMTLGIDWTDVEKV